MAKTDAPKKEPKPRNWKYVVERWIEVDRKWIEAAQCKDTAACRKWIEDNEDAKDGDKYRTIIVTSEVVVKVTTETRRTLVASSHASREANNEDQGK